MDSHGSIPAMAEETGRLVEAAPEAAVGPAAGWPRRPPALLAAAAALCLGGAALGAWSLGAWRKGPPADVPPARGLRSGGNSNGNCNGTLPRATFPLYNGIFDTWCDNGGARASPHQWGEGDPWACYHYGVGEDDRWCQERARAGWQGGVAFHYTPFGSDGTCGGCSCCKRSATNDCFHQTDGADATEVSPEEWSAADKWFDAEVSVFAIVMPNRKDRLELLQARWSKEGVKFEVTPGIDVTAPGAYQVAKQKGMVPAGYNMYKAETANNWARQGGLAGDVGCAAAHRNTMEIAVTKARRTHKPLALILEDDATPVRNFKVKMYRLVHKEVPCGWAMINLNARCARGRCVSPHLLQAATDWGRQCNWDHNLGTTALLYQVEQLPHIRSMLEQTSWDDQRPICVNFDRALGLISDRVAYYVFPGILPAYVWDDHSTPSSRW